MAGWLMLGVAILGVLHMVLHSYEEQFENLPVPVGRWFDMNSESSIATWYNVVLLALVAAAALVAAVAEKRTRERRAWVVLGLLVGLLSIDEKVQVHEQLPELVGLARGEGLTHEWLLPGVILAGAGVAVLAVFLRPLDARVRRGLLVALLVYGAGAVLVEALGGLAVRTLPLEHPVRTAFPVWELLEEGLEMLGCVVALSVIVAHLRRDGVLVVDHPS